MRKRAMAVTLQSTFSITSGQFKQGFEESLRNPYNSPMEITEIRLRTGVSNGALSQTVPGGLMRVLFRVGNTPLSSDYVPFWSFSPSLNANVEIVNGTYNFTWKLDRPIYLRANEFLIPVFSYYEIPGVTASNVQIAYSGRALISGFKEPLERWLPWVPIWIGNANAGGATYSEQSTETDLANATSTDVEVRRLLCRSLLGDSALLSNGTQEFNSQLLFDGSIVHRMVSSTGATIVRDPTPQASLYSFLDRAWTVPFAFAPRSFWLTYVDSDLTTVLSQNTVQHQVSMICYRKVRL